MRQPGGGTLHGKADRTPGYRGMHSFTLAFDHYFVPAENLVGEAGGLGQGLLPADGGLRGRPAADRRSRLRRRAGGARSAPPSTSPSASSSASRSASYELTQYQLGRMATHIAAGRQLTYAAAPRDGRGRASALEPAMAKLFACDVAVEVTQDGQLLHGGWGYAEEYPICRYVVDAQVLPIFEGVKPILELKVIARQLLAG